MAEPTESSSTGPDRGRVRQGSYSSEWKRKLATADPVVSWTSEQLRDLVEDLEPATDDDVPWSFPVRTPLKPTRE